MAIIEDIRDGWGWTGINPFEVVGENDFGNLLVRDARGNYWRICPEDLYCRVIATDRDELDALYRDQEFLGDWHMNRLVEDAERHLGPLEPGRKYCLKIPGTLGGEYGGNNLASITLAELIRASGHIARQLEGLPDGSKVSLRITE
ncbi:T6SS immunity protein Tdi1 domain-containing protein [Piscinibacter defluvii]|uniref:T6SS immunity protein Tdi1 domain-containing protein n=1 Tax=Piscinibacter defluvii TaxID=1796922 RepID=UPI000FDD17FB|nr:T6SS immunity protein Tdi1 domain-containing protein [Piscinibacter defluvii]